MAPEGAVRKHMADRLLVSPVTRSLPEVPARVEYVFGRSITVLAPGASWNRSLTSSLPPASWAENRMLAAFCRESGSLIPLLPGRQIITPGLSIDLKAASCGVMMSNSLRVKLAIVSVVCCRRLCSCGPISGDIAITLRRHTKRNYVCGPPGVRRRFDSCDPLGHPARRSATTQPDEE